MRQVFAAVNGMILPSDRASLQISDLSIQRGFGVFDFFKTLNYRPVFLEELKLVAPVASEARGATASRPAQENRHNYSRPASYRR